MGERETERQRQREVSIGELYLELSERSLPQLNNNSNSLVISIQLLSFSLAWGWQRK